MSHIAPALSQTTVQTPLDVYVHINPITTGMMSGALIMIIIGILIGSSGCWMWKKHVWHLHKRVHLKMIRK